MSLCEAWKCAPPSVCARLCAPGCAPPAVRPRLVEVVSACIAPSAAVLVCAFMVGLHRHDCCGGTVGRRRWWRSWRYEPAHSRLPWCVDWRVSLGVDWIGKRMRPNTLRCRAR